MSYADVSEFPETPGSHEQGSSDRSREKSIKRKKADWELALDALLFQTAFCFALFGSYIFISDQKVKAKSNRSRNCIFSFSWESQGHTLDHFFYVHISVITSPTT